MTEQQTGQQRSRPGVWPLWARALVWGVLAVLLGFGLVEVFSGGASGQQAAAHTAVSVGIAGLLAALIRLVTAIAPGEALAARLQRRMLRLVDLAASRAHDAGAAPADDAVTALVDREARVAGQLLGSGLPGEAARVVLALADAALPRLGRSPLRRELLRSRGPARRLLRRAERARSR